MSDLLRSVAAQVRAEATARLRSPGTFVAALALVILTFAWIPNPASNVATISWTNQEGVWTTARYSAAYLGLASAVLASSFLSLAGWYLVAGAVRRDRETGVGVIFAATPVTRAGYLAGKFAAHWVYLLALSSLAIPSAILFFAWHGEGAFAPIAIALPSLLLLPPAMAMVAAFAILFDVLPVLRGRAGPAIWFFTWAFLFLMIPTLSSGAFDPAAPPSAWPPFDPTGIATIRLLIAKALPEAAGGSISFGIHINEGGYRRVDWPGITLGGGVLAARLATLLMAIPALAIATMLFDRFAGSARSPARRPPRRKAPRADSGIAAADPMAAPSVAGGHRAVPLPARVAVEPSALRAVVAEAWLAWQTAGFLRLPLLAAAVLSAVLPDAARPWALIALLFLLGPALSEVAAREALRGTRALIGSQPGVPLSFILWKAAATVLLVLALGAPAALRAAATSPVRGATILMGLAFVACFSVVAGAWTKSGKLFAGVHTALMYAAVNKLPAVDFCGVMTDPPQFGISALYGGAGLALVGLAVLVERRAGG